MDTKNMMDVIGKRAGAAIPQKPDDYLGEDGLLYCGTCRTPKQARVPIGGTSQIFATPCACEEKKDKERTEREKAAKREENRKKIFYGIDSLCAATFEMDDGARPELVARLKKYVEIFERAKKDGYGLILCGSEEGYIDALTYGGVDRLLVEYNLIPELN